MVKDKDKLRYHRRETSGSFSGTRCCHNMGSVRILDSCNVTPMQWTLIGTRCKDRPWSVSSAMDLDIWQETAKDNWMSEEWYMIRWQSTSKKWRLLQRTVKNSQRRRIFSTRLSESVSTEVAKQVWRTEDWWQWYRYCRHRLYYTNEWGVSYRAWCCQGMLNSPSNKLYCHNLLCQEIYLQTEGMHQLAETKTLFCLKSSTPIRIDDQYWITHHGYPSHGWHESTTG